MFSQKLSSFKKLFKKPRIQFRSSFAKEIEKMHSTEALKGLGYTFNTEGQMCQLDKEGQITRKPFQFNISDNHDECQAHYEQLGEAVTYYVYHLLETELKLKKLPVPKDAKDSTFIFVSDGYDEKDVLLVLIHGSGVVRAGQWARSLIINDNLNTGTQIPYIKAAIAKNYGVMVLNTNDCHTPQGKAIPHSGTAEEHAKYVWENYVMQTRATSIVIVAHSYGGVVTVTLADDVKQDFERKVKAIALTDSVHGYSNKKITPFLKKVSVNWISSECSLDTPMKTPEFDITRVSAGHERHEMTSHSCIESVFKFIEVKLKEA